MSIYSTDKSLQIGLPIPNLLKCDLHKYEFVANTTFKNVI